MDSKKIHKGSKLSHHTIKTSYFLFINAIN
jgi:hypothetical protein